MVYFQALAIQGNGHKWMSLALAAVFRPPAHQVIEQAPFLSFSKNPFFLRF